MKKITLEEAFKILENASALVVDDNALVYQSLYDLNGDDDNEFLFLSYTDKRRKDKWHLKFAEKDNREVEVCGCSMFLYDAEGDYTQLTILGPISLE